MIQVLDHPTLTRSASKGTEWETDKATYVNSPCGY